MKKSILKTPSSAVQTVVGGQTPAPIPNTPPDSWQTIVKTWIGIIICLAGIVLFIFGFILPSLIAFGIGVLLVLIFNEGLKGVKKLSDATNSNKILIGIIHLMFLPIVLRLWYGLANDWLIDLTGMYPKEIYFYQTITFIVAVGIVYYHGINMMTEKFTNKWISYLLITGVGGLIMGFYLFLSPYQFFVYERSASPKSFFWVLDNEEGNGFLDVRFTRESFTEKECKKKDTGEEECKEITENNPLVSPIYGEVMRLGKKSDRKKAEFFINNTPPFSWFKSVSAWWQKPSAIAENQIQQPTNIQLTTITLRRGEVLDYELNLNENTPWVKTIGKKYSIRCNPDIDQKIAFNDGSEYFFLKDGKATLPHKEMATFVLQNLSNQKTVCSIKVF